MFKDFHDYERDVRRTCPSFRPRLFRRWLCKDYGSGNFNNHYGCVTMEHSIIGVCIHYPEDAEKRAEKKAAARNYYPDNWPMLKDCTK